MRTFTRYLWVLTAFGLGLGTVYWLITEETTGAVLLWIFGLMPLILGAWTARHEHRGDPALPEDDPEADPAAEAGQPVGIFPAVTLWPLVFVAGIVTTGAGLVYGTLLLWPGIAVVAMAILGLMRESRS
jgi:hypothetical protein